MAPFAPSHPFSLALSTAALAVLVAPLAAHEEDPIFPAHFESLELPGKIHKAIDVEFLPDGSHFVAGKRGEVHYRPADAGMQATLVLDLTDEVVHTGDRGLLCIEPHPGFVPDGGPTSWLYLVYTVSPVPGEDPVFNEDDKFAFGRLARYRIITAGTDVVADLASRQVLLGNQMPDGSVPDAIASLWSSHAPGSLVFGFDGTLFVSTGDGAHASEIDPGGIDPGGFQSFTHPETGLVGPISDDQDCGVFRSQDLRSLAGKILRIDPASGLGLPSNPFFDGDPSSFASRVWALGLRNPYRVELVPGTPSPGELLIGDVGWNAWEELNRCVGGENFRWPCFQGPVPEGAYDTHTYVPNPFGFADCGNPGPGVPTGPILTWNHAAPALMQPSGIHVDEFGVPQAGLKGNAALAGPVYPGGDYPPEYAGVTFLADYADEWISLLRFDGQGAVSEVVDFASRVDRIVDLEVHPVSGDLHYASLGAGPSEGRVYRVRYGSNLTPTATLLAAPTFGDPPLLVAFDASPSTDPENDPLTYEWDYGDGSPLASGASVQHSFAAEGLYDVVLSVTDDGGLTDTETVQIAVGNVPPNVSILAPLPGELFAEGLEVFLIGEGEDPGGGAVALEWTIDLYHDTHVHPDSATLAGANTSYVVEAHGDPDELFYLRVELTATSEVGLKSSDHLYLYPGTNLFDPTGTALPIARTQELVPPFPTGVGNPDLEVVRDGVFPPPGTVDRDLQFDSFHDGEQGDDDWIGFELSAVPPDEVRFVALVFNEGMHFSGGGWFDELRIEVRSAGVWEEAQDLAVRPTYPFELAATPGFDGVGFDTYELHFDPIHGDAIRLRGDPGGVSGFLSAGELRVRWIRAAPVPEPWTDLTSDATGFIAKVLELDPPFPQGGGSLDVGTLSNNTWPPLGSSSLWAQLDTFHFGDQGNEDWIGYSFDEWQTFERVLFQEGFHDLTGGWFADLAVETRTDSAAPWTPVTGLSVVPMVPGDTSPSGTYETFELTFARTVARELRLIGAPGGTIGFVSCGELRVFGPGTTEDCGWIPYGETAGGSNVLALASTTPPALGAPVVLTVAGASGPAAGLLLFGNAPFSLPLLGGTLLVDLTGAAMLPFAIDASGTSELFGTMPSNPAFLGQSSYLQAIVGDAGQPAGVALSNGLDLKLCP